MNTASCKAKGRMLQDLVRNKFREVFKNELEEDDIKSAVMGTSGTDLVLSPAARKLIQFDVECKNQEKLNINEALKQCEENTADGRIPLLIFHKNRGKVYAAIEFENLIRLLYDAKQ